MKATITGMSGFIGSALNKKLLSFGWETHEELRPDVDYVFLFGSPSSNNWFNHALSYSVRETIENFINAIEFCREHRIKLIYPSSGTIYQGDTAYSKTKLILELLSSMYDNTLGLRIFAGYGVGEAHKSYYSSVVYSFIQEMKTGKRPVIWGDGTQTRDFVYIDDIIDNIIKFKDEVGTRDIGTGQSHCLAEVVELINQQLRTNIKPDFIDKPESYIDNSVCENPCECNISLEQGIERIINEKTMG